MSEVAIVGVGCVDFRPITPELSYKELMFEAAVKAYATLGEIMDVLRKVYGEYKELIIIKNSNTM